MKRLIVSLMLAACAVMMPAPVQGQRLAVLADIHVTPGNEADKMLREAVAEINASAYDLVVVNGDLTNEGSDAELANVKSILDGVRHPLAVLPGNHEDTWSQSATKTFVDLWGNDRFVRQLGDVVIVGINCGPYMKMGDGHVKQEDLHWLRRTLDEYLSAGTARRVLSFNHYPLQDDLDNYKDYVNLLADYPVIAHLNGHYHTWREYVAGDIPAAMTRALYMKGDGYGYAIVDISSDWIKIYNKRLGCEAEPMYAWQARRARHQRLAADSVAVSTALPGGYVVERVWADSASVFTRLAFDSERVFFGNSLGQARAVNKRSSQLEWQHATGASLFARPVVLKGAKRVAVPCSDAIEVLDAATGRPVKRYASAQGPYVADGLLTDDAYIQGGYKRLERRHPATAKLVWSYDSLFNYCQAAPVVDGRDVIFGAWDTNLRSVDLNTGRLNWVWNNGSPANLLGPGNVVPVVTADRVYIVAPDRYMTAIDRRTGATLWRDNSVRYRESMGGSADDSRVYAKTMDGALVAVDATSDTFKMLWSVDLGLGYDHAPCVVLEHDGVVYAGSRRGIVCAVDALSHTLLWSCRIGSSEVNGLDLDPYTGDVYMSLIEGTIYRIRRFDRD